MEIWKMEIWKNGNLENEYLKKRRSGKMNIRKKGNWPLGKNEIQGKWILEK